jgi:hypothetical protein
VATSTAERIGTGTTVPAGAGGATQVVARQDDPRTGLVRVRTSAEAEGAAAPAAYLDGEEPTGAVGETRIDAGRRLASGEWVTLEAAGSFLGGRVTRVAVRRRLRAGGASLAVFRRTGGYRPSLRDGAVAEWTLTEEVTLFALGVLRWADLAGLGPPPGAWRLDPEQSDDAPGIEERGGDAAHHLWARTLTRVWLWDADGSPLDQPAVQAALVQRFEPGEAGPVQVVA